QAVDVGILDAIAKPAHQDVFEAELLDELDEGVRGNGRDRQVAKRAGASVFLVRFAVARMGRMCTRGHKASCPLKVQAARRGPARRKIRKRRGYACAGAP